MDRTIYDRVADEEWGNAPQEVSYSEKSTEPETRKAVGIVVVRDGKFLAGTRTSNTGRGQVCGPGGHVENGESPAFAALRETEEEFGIVPNSLTLIDVKEPNSESELENYLFLCDDFNGEPECNDGEMKDPRFMSDSEIDELGENAFPAFYDGIQRLKNALFPKGPDDAVERFKERRKQRLSEKS